MKLLKLLSASIFLLLNCVHGQWLSQNSTTGNELTSLFFISPDEGWVAGSNGTILHSTNGGNLWTAQNSTTNHYLNSIRFLNASTGFVSGFYYYNYDIQLNILLKTTSGGADWDTLAYDGSYQNHEWNTSADFLDSQNGFLTRGTDDLHSHGRAMKSSNGGINWLSMSLPSYISYHKVLCLNSNTAVLVGNKWSEFYDTNYIFRTTNAGNSWQEVHKASGLTLGDVTYGYGLVTVSGSLPNSTGFILRSTNLGANWSTLTFGSVPQLRSSYFINLSTGWGVGYSGTIIYTTNAGADWSFQQQGEPFLLNRIQVFNNCTGYTVGSQGKIFKTTNCGVTSITPVSNEVPADFFLYQNYPNPFNAVTKIRFDVPRFPLNKGGQRGLLVTLSIFDILGKEIASLVNESLHPGTYEVQWDATDFSSGVYLYKLITGDFSETKKMILIE
jgi:photosystem II stability/assembly factor-like uncharacterized protein